MEENKDLSMCWQYLDELYRCGKRAATNFDIHIKTLEKEATANGLDDNVIDKLIDIIIKKDLGSVKMISLIKCLVPKYKIADKCIKRVLIWCLGDIHEIPVTVSLMTIQWITGLWDNGLVNKGIVNIFYDVLFYTMLKSERLNRHIARLIYLLTKPEDVTRRNVTRLLTVQQKHNSVQKYITTLLLLFKSYKPELVPEKIKAVNVESVWRPIPEVLRIRLLNAKARCNDQSRSDTEEYFTWTTFSMGTGSKSAKSKQPLVPSVGYFHFGSDIFREKNTKSIFDVGRVEDLGKYHLNIDLPCNAISLLANMAGYHLLTFASFQYQSRFSYNLYNTLQTAFILEHEKYPKGELEKLLDQTLEFSRYMQQGILVVNLFLERYLYLNTGRYQRKLLSLMQWMTCISVSELQDKMIGHIRNMYFESSIEMKCEILTMIRMLIMNLFVDQGFDECRRTEGAPFLGQGPIDSLADIFPVLIKTAEDLVTSGLNIHSYDLLLLDEALTLYEQIAILETRSNVETWTLAPRALIYGGFLSKSVAILSRICGLLLRYRKMNLLLKQKGARKRFKENVQTVTSYVQDIVRAFWFEQAFSSTQNSNFFKKLPRDVLKDLQQIDMDAMLSIESHSAILPHKYTLSRQNIRIETKEDVLKVSRYYFPNVDDFLSLFVE